MKELKPNPPVEKLIDDLYPVMELAISHKLQEKRLHQMCKLKKDLNPVPHRFNKTYDVIGDFYKLHTSKNALIKYKKNVTIGQFLIFNEVLIYHHIYPQFGMMVAIREFLKDSGYDLKYVGPYIIFEQNEKSIRLNDIIELYHRVYLVKLSYTQIANMYVASDRANRMFILSHYYLYKESHTHPVILNHSLYSEMIEKDIIHTYTELLAMLVNAKQTHKSINEVEKYYSELLVKNLTK